MKLYLMKDQAKKGMLKKSIKFAIRARVELTDEEQELVQRYKQFDFNIVDFGKESISLQSLMNGQTLEQESIDLMIKLERILKEACEKFSLYLQVMKEFGGEEVFEFPQVETA